MPHFGLMDEKNMEDDAAALLRAKLHLRCGRRRLLEGKMAEAVSTLYDAVQAGMRWRALKADWHDELHELGKEVLEDDAVLYRILRDKGEWDQALDFDSFRKMTFRAIEGEPVQVDRARLLDDIEKVMTRLGVMPFDENELPPEDPETF